MTQLLFTIGTALRRAETNHLPVEVLVQGHWLSGNVAGVDGHGLVLSTHSSTPWSGSSPSPQCASPRTCRTPRWPTPSTSSTQLTVAAVGDDAWAMPGPYND